MKDQKGLLALMGMAAMFSGLSHTEKREISEREIQAHNKQLEAKKKRSKEKIMLNRGLTKFTFSNVDIWALNYNSAKRKAKKKGLI